MDTFEKIKNWILKLNLLLNVDFFSNLYVQKRLPSTENSLY